MKTITLLFAVTLIPLLGCGTSVDNDKNGTSFCESGCEEPENNETPNNVSSNNEPENNITPPVDLPELDGTFVAGHLGQYWDCADEAYGGPDGDSADPGAGACAEGSDCPTFSQCEGAQVTLSLSNDSDTAGENILVDQIELFGADGVSRAVLPLEATIDTATNEPFDGQLEPGEEVMLRVEYQGPYDPYTLLAPADEDGVGDSARGGAGIIETTFSSDNHADLTVESGELYPVPEVDT